MTDTPKVKPISDAELAQWRNDFNSEYSMRSAIWEYAPEEFGLLLDEVDTLRERLRIKEEQLRLAEGVIDAAGVISTESGVDAWDRLDNSYNAYAAYRAAIQDPKPEENK